MRIKIERLREKIKAECARVLMTEIRDPRAGFLTVQNVELSDDLRNAKVFVSVLGEEPERRRIMRMLADARGFVQRAVASTLRTRVTPTLSFVLDTSIDKSFKVAAILEQIKKDDASRKAASASPLEISEDLSDEGAAAQEKAGREEDEEGVEDDREDGGEAEQDAQPPLPKKKEGGRGLRGKKKAKARGEDDEDLYEEDDADDEED
ncbi:30S ribosome-binding factor RbfA [bacterium]|nr:30S ribosome-binding factor RbfA [bacterium]